MELSRRKEDILATIIRSYIRSGEPVGSKALCEELRSVSSATIRNEMSELCELGYLDQPHTSAGRIPTDRAFRLYIDRLMTLRSLTDKEKNALDTLLPVDNDCDERSLRWALKSLADATHCVALLTSEATGILVHKVELIPMGQYTALLVLVTTTGSVQSRMLRFASPLTDALITRFINVVEKGLIGTEISAVQPAILQTLVAGSGEYALELTPLLSALTELISETGESKLELAGQSNLLMYGEFSPVRVREILEMFSRNEMLSLLDMWNRDSGVILGSDTAYRALDTSSIIVSRYKTDARSGYIGVIGPLRMDYDIMIPSINYLAGALCMQPGKKDLTKGLTI